MSKMLFEEKRKRKKRQWKQMVTHEKALKDPSHS